VNQQQQMAAATAVADICELEDRAEEIRIARAVKLSRGNLSTNNVESPAE
jgi:hypothetical protein